MNKRRKFRIADFMLFILCFLIALAIWVFVMGIETEEYEHTFTNIPVELYGVSKLQNEHGMSIINDHETTVNVTVKGSRREIMKYASEDFLAHVEVGSITSAGTYSLNVTAELPNGGLSIVSTSPSAINVFVDETYTKIIPLKVDLQYSIADSLTMHDPMPAIDSIEIAGPKTRLDAIKEARVEYNLGTVTTSVNFNAPIKLYDGLGNEVVNPYIMMSVSDVIVSVKVTGEKSVPLSLNYTADDLSRYNYKLTLSEERLLITGDPSDLNDIDAIRVNVGNITNVSGGTIDVKDIAIPKDVALVENENPVTINYTVEKTLKAAKPTNQPTS